MLPGYIFKSVWLGFLGIYLFIYLFAGWPQTPDPPACFPRTRCAQHATPGWVTCLEFSSPVYCTAQLSLAHMIPDKVLGTHSIAKGVHASKAFMQWFCPSLFYVNALSFIHKAYLNSPFNITGSKVGGLSYSSECPLTHTHVLCALSSSHIYFSQASPLLNYQLL